MHIYGLKNCDKCRAAVKEMGNAGKAPILIDVRADPLSADDLARFLDAFGEKLVNTRSTTWRGLSEAERKGTPQDLLAAHPALMKRPVIDTGDALYLGWDAGVKAAVL